MDPRMRQLVQALRGGLQDAPAAVGGALEVPLHLATGMLAQPVGGIAGLLRGMDTGNLDAAGKAQDETTRALTYEPRLPVGQNAVAALSQGQRMVKSLTDKLPEKMQDMGLPAGAAAALGTGLDLVPQALTEEEGGMARGLLSAPGKALKRGGKKVISTIPWDKMSLGEAQKAAAAGEHLQRSSGGYVGAPEGVTTPGKLAKMRAGVDADVAKGAFGADWYERARDAIQRVSGSDPAKADQLSKMLALYSPVTPVDANMGMALKQINDYVLNGDKGTAKPYVPYQAAKGKQIMAGGDPYLGEKVGVYEDHINPNKAKQSQVRGVNDIWMGRSYGYPGKEGAPFERGFHESEHSFLTGENLEAARRAKDAGILPEGVDPNVGSTQAAAWVGKRYQQLLDERAPAFKALIKDEDYRGLAKLDEDLRRRAAVSYDSYLPKYTASETYEGVPGRSTGHLPRAADLPFEDKQKLSSAVDWSKPGERDPLYEALGMYQQPTASGLGQFTETVKRPRLEAAIRNQRTGDVTRGGSHMEAMLRMSPEEQRLFETEDGHSSFADGFVLNPEGRFLDRYQAGNQFRKAGGEASFFRDFGEDGNRLASEDLSGDFLTGGSGAVNPANPLVDTPQTDYNPNRAAKPMVSYSSGGRDFDPASSSLMQQTSAFRSVMDAQAAGAWGGVSTGSGNTGDAARVTFKKPMDVKGTKRMYKLAADAGLDLVDTGDGTFKLTKFMGAEGKRMKAADFSRALAKLEPKLKGVAEVERGGHVGGYQEVPWGDEGSGVTTDWLMNQISPHVGEKLTSTQAVRDALVRKNVNETQFRADNPFTVGDPRVDLQKLRGMVATHGLEGVRALIQKAGGGVKGAAKLGLPAAAIAYLNQGGPDAQDSAQ